jgi:hypothetical protein
VAPKGALLELPAHEAEALLSDGWVKEECRACAAEEHLELGLGEGVVPSATATTPAAAAAAAAAQERGQLGRLGEARVEVGEAADSLLQGAAQARRCI